MKHVYLLIVITIFTNTLFSQTGISGAESVAYHKSTKSYFISSLLGDKIYKIDSLGQQTIFYEDIKAGGNSLKGDTLFFSSGTNVKGLNVNTKEIVFDLAIDEAEMLDGVAYDDQNNLYVVEVLSNYIVKINLTDNSQIKIAEEGLERNPQDIFFDKFQNRLLVCSWAANSGIVEVSLDDYSVRKIIDSFGRFDGITIDEYGLIYLSTHTEGGRVIMFDNNFLMGPIVLEIGLEEPAGLDYNIDKRLLAVPNFAGGVVKFIQLPEQFLYPLFTADTLYGNAPLEVTFKNKTVSSGEIAKIEWDFNGDGNIDSEEADPVNIYNDAGTYSVKLAIQTAQSESETTNENFVKVFDNEAAVLLNQSNSLVTVAASPELNITENFTIEAFINPLEYPTSARGGTIIDKNSIKIFTTGFASGDKGDYSFITQLRFPGSPSLLISAPDSTIDINKWQHIAVSYNSDLDKVKMYINGNEIETILIGNGELSGPLTDNAEEDLYIGNDANTLSGYYGLIDEIRIWNEVRTESKLKEFAVQGLTENETGLIGYWNMNVGTGSTLADNSINNNSGVINNGEFGHGVKFDQITSVNNSADEFQPTDFELYQNYPNPFNPVTTIKFNLPVNTQNSTSKVQLVIFDLLGREIRTLLNEELQSGTHEIKFDGSELSSGIYFYQLEAGSFVRTKKLMLLK